MKVETRGPTIWYFQCCQVIPPFSHLGQGTDTEVTLRLKTGVLGTPSRDNTTTRLKTCDSGPAFWLRSATQSYTDLWSNQVFYPTRKTSTFLKETEIEGESRSLVGQKPWTDYSFVELSDGSRFKSKRPIWMLWNVFKPEDRRSVLHFSKKLRASDKWAKYHTIFCNLQFIFKQSPTVITNQSK